MQLLPWLAAAGTAVLVHHGWKTIRRNEHSTNQTIREAYKQVWIRCPAEILSSEYSSLDYVLESREVHLNLRTIPISKANGGRCLRAIHDLVGLNRIQSVWLHLDAETSGFPVQSQLSDKKDEIKKIAQYCRDIVISFHEEDWESGHWTNIRSTLHEAELSLEWYAIDAPFSRSSPPSQDKTQPPMLYWDDQLISTLRFPYFKDRIWAVSRKRLVSGLFQIDDLVPRLEPKNSIATKNYLSFLEQNPLNLFLPLDLTQPPEKQDNVELIVKMCEEQSLFCNHIIYQFGNNMLTYNSKHVLWAINRLGANDGIFRFGLAPSFWRSPADGKNRNPCTISALRECAFHHSLEVERFILDLSEMVQSKSRFVRPGFGRLERRKQDDELDDRNPIFPYIDSEGSDGSMRNFPRSTSTLGGDNYDPANWEDEFGDLRPESFGESDSGSESDFSGSSFESSDDEQRLPVIMGKAFFLSDEFPFTITFHAQTSDPPRIIQWLNPVPKSSPNVRDPTLAVEMRLN